MRGRALLLIACAPILLAFAAAWTHTINWGFSGVSRAKEWVSPDGRLSLQSQMPDMSTAWDCWPTVGVRPVEHSLCEITLNRYQWDHAKLERISLSAMADNIDGGAYRVSIEKGRAGEHKPLIVCFDNATPGGTAYCPLKVDVDGVWIWEDGEYRRVASR